MLCSRQTLLGWIVLLTTATGLTQATESQANEAGRMQTFTISGSTGEPDVMLKGFPGATLQSDSNGNYCAEVPYGWSGTITPQKSGFTFEPATLPIGPLKADLKGQDFIAHAQTFVISGSVGMTGVMLEGLPELVTADEKGLYKTLVPYKWTGTVTPVKEGYEFTPRNKTYPIPVTRNYENESYKAAVISFEVSGTVMVNGTPVAGVVLQGLPGKSTTTANGTYNVKVPYHWNGIVTPVKEGYTFEPPIKSYENIDSPMTAQDYSGSVIQYTMSGTIGIEGVTLKGFPGNVVTGFDGQYTATIPHGWGQEVIPTLEGYAFDPPKRAYAKITQNQAGQDYAAKEIFVTISGNTGQPGVILEGLQNSNEGPLISDAKGGYSIKVRFGWSGTVTPRKEGCVFKPEEKPYNRVTRDLLAENYTSSRMRCVISGMIGLPDVVMKGFPTQVKTLQNGTYNTTVDYDWSGEVTPEKRGFEFEPPSISYSSVKESQFNQDYTAKEKLYKISGKFTSDQGPVEGITVMTGLGSEIQPAMTDVEGHYEMTVPYNWRGTIQFSKEGYDFEPREQIVTAVTRDLVYNFTAKVRMLTITDEIVIDGQGLPGVTVTADNGGTTAATDASGKYKVQVPYAWTGSISPTKKGIEFDPPSKPYENVTKDIDINKDRAFGRMMDGRRSSRVYPVQSTGMNVPSPRIRIVPTSQAKPEVFTAISDDIQVMLHILRKNLAKKPAAMAGVFPDYGDLLGRDQDRLEGLYVQGYGAFLFSEADLTSSAPLEKKADKGQIGSTPADPVWDQARQEMGSSSDPYANINPRPGTAGITLDQGWDPEDLVKELIQTFKHASNIRHLDPNERSPCP